MKGKQAKSEKRKEKAKGKPQWTLAGPMWLGPLHEREELIRMYQLAESIGWFADEATTGGEADEATAGGKADEATTGGNADQATTGGEADEGTAGGKADQATTGGKADEATTGGEADKATTGGEVDEATMGGKADEATTGGKADEATTGGEADKATTGGVGGTIVDDEVARETVANRKGANKGAGTSITEGGMSAIWRQSIGLEGLMSIMLEETQVRPEYPKPYTIHPKP
jgi:hypothetical protein